MASLGSAAGSALVEGSPDFTPIPAGVYDMEVVDSAVVPTKAGTGTMLKLQLKVCGGRYDNRRVFDQINIENQNAQAQEIGQRQLSDLCRACGLAAVPAESDEFHGIPIRARVKIKDDANYGPRNEIARYVDPADAGGAPAPAAPARQAAAPARAASSPPAGNRGAPPWGNRRAG